MSKIKYHKLTDNPDGFRYILEEDYIYYSRTFNRTKTLKAGMLSDGATGVSDLGAKEEGWRKYWCIFIRWLFNTYFGDYIKLNWDIVTASWWVHDAFCEDPFWDDGTPISNFIASTIFACILYVDGYRVRAIPYWWGTFLFGGQKIKQLVGWIWVKEDNADE